MKSNFKVQRHWSELPETYQTPSMFWFLVMFGLAVFGFAFYSVLYSALVMWGVYL